MKAGQVRDCAKNYWIKLKDHIKEFGKKSLRCFKKHKKRFYNGGLGAGVVLLVFLAGMERDKSQRSEVLTQTHEDIQITEAEMETEAEPQKPELEEDQIELLDGITLAMKEKNWQEAAALLHQNEQKLQYLFYQVMEGSYYCYRDGFLSETVEGTGLVLKKPGSVFYGSFQNRMPQGEGTALRVIQLDALRYDYSDGSWNRGQMEGNGTVGYDYYEGIQDKGNQAVQKVLKEGVFDQDLIEGACSYYTTNSKGESSRWDMHAEKGRVVLDERWTYEEEKQLYYLASNQDSGHAYTLSESAKDQPSFRNMLPWKE